MAVVSIVLSRPKQAARPNRYSSCRDATNRFFHRPTVFGCRTSAAGLSSRSQLRFAAIEPRVQPIAIVFDLMQPVRPRRRFVDEFAPAAAVSRPAVVEVAFCACRPCPADPNRRSARCAVGLVESDHPRNVVGPGRGVQCGAACRPIENSAPRVITVP
jgi:hypothetical protein